MHVGRLTLGSVRREQQLVLLDMLSRCNRKTTGKGNCNVRLLIADDHVVVREALKGMLQAVPGWLVIAEAGNGFEVLNLVASHQPDIMILDLGMPQMGGVETLRRLQKEIDAPKVLVLSAQDDEVSVCEAMDAGAHGYVPKSASAEELRFALRAIEKGQTYVSPTVASAVINRGKSGGSNRPSPLAVLSAREREVMKLLSEGMPNRDVAKTLHISPRTVDSHRSKIMKKLGLTSNAELAQLALRCGLVS